MHNILSQNDITIKSGSNSFIFGSTDELLKIETEQLIPYTDERQKLEKRE